MRGQSFNFSKKRRKMVEEYIKGAGIEDKRIIKAFLQVPRHEFVLPEYIDQAYVDTALPIGMGQTISQPSLVAIMTQALRLKGDEKVLEIGTGSGYQAAILSRLAKEVFSIEIIGELAERARAIFKRLSYKNVHVVVANGTLGLPNFAPFDAIIVTAAGIKVPSPLVSQLKEGGRIVIPLGRNMQEQELQVGIKQNGKIRLEKIIPVRFVPLVGKYGQSESLGEFI